MKKATTVLIGLAALASVVYASYLTERPQEEFMMEEITVVPSKTTDTLEISYSENFGYDRYRELAKKTLEKVLDDLKYDPANRQAYTQIYKGLMNWESGFSLFAESITGALGPFQPTVETASQFISQFPQIRLYAPKEFFIEHKDGTYSWRNPKGKNALEEHKRYGAELSRKLRSMIESKDLASAAEFDSRMDPYINIMIGVKNFENNMTEIKRYISEKDEALRLTIISHNLGIAAVRRHIKKGCRTADSLLDSLSDDDSIDASKVAEVREFYRSVTALSLAYARNEDPEVSNFSRYNIR